MRGIPDSGKDCSRIIFLLLTAALIVNISSSPVQSKDNRRIAALFCPTFYITDPDYFNVNNSTGASVGFRYEIYRDTYFENSLGGFRDGGTGYNVDSFCYRFGVTTLVPILIPYRPLAHLGVAFLTSDPPTVVPTETYRPSQTTFYVVAGAGVNYSLGWYDIAAELRTDFMITPYRYVIYRFYRDRVESHQERFMHLTVSLGLSYTF